MDGRCTSKKQAELIAGGVNSVEIDLLRAGQHVTAAPPERLPRSYRGPCRICVWHGARPDHWEVYRVPLKERLPAIAIPLRQPTLMSHLTFSRLSIAVMRRAL